MEGEQALVGRAAHRQRAFGRLAQIDIGIAFVGEDDEVVLIGQREQACANTLRSRTRLRDWMANRYRPRRCVPAPLWAAPRSRARNPVAAVRRHEQRLGARAQRRRGIALIEWIGQKNCGPLSRLGFRHDREQREEQSFARAVQRQQIFLRIDRRARKAETLDEPSARRLAPFLAAVDRRIVAEIFRMLGNRVQHESRHGTIGIADRETDRCLARLMRIEQRRKLGERRRRKCGKAAGKHPRNLVALSRAVQRQA